MFDIFFAQFTTCRLTNTKCTYCEQYASGQDCEKGQMWLGIGSKCPRGFETDFSTGELN
jgi:hypothetical protein